MPASTGLSSRDRKKLQREKTYLLPSLHGLSEQHHLGAHCSSVHTLGFGWARPWVPGALARARPRVLWQEGGYSHGRNRTNLEIPKTSELWNFSKLLNIEISEHTTLQKCQNVMRQLIHRSPWYVYDTYRVYRI